MAWRKYWRLKSYFTEEKKVSGRLRQLKARETDARKWRWYEYTLPIWCHVMYRNGNGNKRSRLSSLAFNGWMRPPDSNSNYYINHLAAMTVLVSTSICYSNDKIGYTNIILCIVLRNKHIKAKIDFDTVYCNTKIIIGALAFRSMDWNVCYSD